MKVISPLIFVMVLGLAVILAAPAWGDMVRGPHIGAGIIDFLPAPQLLSPVTQDVALGGKEHVTFTWLLRDVVRTAYFDFKLYKGYHATAQNLILHKRYSYPEVPIKIPASFFEVNQVYTWTLVQVFNGGEKSEASFSSFKIIGK